MQGSFCALEISDDKMLSNITDTIYKDWGGETNNVRASYNEEKQLVRSGR